LHPAYLISQDQSFLGIRAGSTRYAHQACFAVSVHAGDDPMMRARGISGEMTFRL